MKIKHLLPLCLLLLPFLSNAQKSKRFKKTNISVSTTLNYYPSVDTYSWEDTFSTIDKSLILKFTTATSGLFVIEEGESIFVKRVHSSKLLSQPLGMGATVRFAKLNETFHEFSLTKLSFTKSYDLVLDTYSKDTSYTSPAAGYQQKAFVFGARYEFGKVFGEAKNSRIRFGFSAGIEPTFYKFKSEPQSVSIFEYPVNAKITTIDATFNPILTARISKKINIDFKLVSSVLLHTFGDVREFDPRRNQDQQKADVAYDFPELDFAYFLAIRYTLKEAIPDKKKRKRKQQ